MIREIHVNKARPGDRPSDQVYHYDAGEKILELGEKFEVRKTEKSSALEELRSKQNTVKMKPVTPKAAHLQGAEL